MTREYDAIVVGASFAGLAVARQLRGRILLLDRHDVTAPTFRRDSGHRRPAPSLLRETRRQCLPLTAEGIRPALYFGEQCGLIVQRVIDGRLSLEQGLAEYRRRVLAYQWAYRWLRWAQWAVQSVPPGWLGSMAEFARRTQGLWWPRYVRFGQLRNGRSQGIGGVQAVCKETCSRR